MKKYIAQAIDHARRHANDWDYFIISTSGFMTGYKQALQNMEELSLGDEEVEMEFKDGTHQLSAATFLKRREENYKLPLEQLIKVYLPMIKSEDLRVHEENGLISFQGTAKRLEP